MKKNILSILSIVVLMSFCGNANAQVREKVQNTMSNVGNTVSKTASNIGSTVSNSVSNFEESVMGNFPPYKLGFSIGLNSSAFSADDFQNKSGFNFGVDLMFDASDLINNTYLRTGLLLQRKGAKIKDMKFRTVYLELPVHYGYAYRVNSNWTVMGETGPYFAFGLGGNCHLAADKEKGTPSYYSKFFSEIYEKQKPTRFDIGWGIAVGGMLNNTHQFMLKYDFGFINMNDAFQQNRNFQISYSYFFE